jgi:glycosyltransferase involved in cell wall biosynthesis
MGRYVRSVLREFATRFADRVELTLLVPDPLPSLTRGRYLAGLPDTIAVARQSAAARLGLDLVWYPWNGMTWLAPVASVATVHDVWPFISPSPDPRVREREQTQYRVAAERAASIIAVSHFTKHELVTRLNVAAERILVIPQGVPPPLAVPEPARVAGSARYVLFVGEVEPRKDVDTLFAAMRQLPDDLRHDTALVIAGRARHIDTRAAGAVRVILTGEIADDVRLASWYAGAAAFAFPSRYEGFGLPVLEAMSYGAPVVASDAASIPEVGGEAALYFPCGDGTALAAALALVLRDGALAARMSASGKQRAAQFDEATRAQRTLAALEAAVRA